MKSRTSHLIHLLVWLLVLTAYVVVLNGLPQAPGLLLTIPAGLGGIAAAQEWSDYLSVPTISLFQYSLEANGLALEHPLCSPAGPCSFGETADRPAESQTPQGGPLQWPRCFSRCFSRRRAARRCWAWVRF